jgi:hypothetical protein
MTAYEALPHPTLRQGDIIVAPSVVLVPPGERDLSSPRRGPGRLGEVQWLALWDGDASTLSPDLSAAVRFSPVLVVSHDCELEKDFNERVRELIAAGRPEADAVAEAERDPTLDPFAVVAPLLPFGDLPAKRHAGVMDGQRIGYFPILQLPRDGGDYFVDLGKLSTISVQLLPQGGKVASLAPESVFELRYKLSEAYAIRDLAVIHELERLTGRTIIRAAALPRDSLAEEIVRTRGRD